ncbi:MAG: peptidase domain-containing ABC transporter [Chitinophagaceae bacterium]|nr:peptidase domain-containing ABC transporter [Chitinophagaceae bacterium]
MYFPFFNQPDHMDCGPTSLRMVIKYYGRSISMQNIRDKTQKNKAGVSLLGISEAAESFGFRTHPLKLSYESLIKDAKLPAILHWDHRHYVVLYKAKRKKIYVADPAKGLITLTEEEFKSHWISDKVDGQDEGIALLLEPAPSFYENAEDSDEKRKKGLQFKNILHYILPYKKLVFQLFVGLGVASLLQLFLPFLTQSIIDTGVNTANIHFVYIILLAQLALFAGRIAVEFVRGWILLHISTRINISILTDFLIKLMKLPVSFFDSKQTGDILQRMNDHKRIESFLTGSSLNVLFSVLNLLVLSAVLAIFNVGIFVVFAIASVLYAVWVLLFLKKRKTLNYKTFSIAAKEQSITIQLVQGMQEIKLNGVEKPMRWAWEGLQAKLFRLKMKGLSLNQWQQAGGFFINEGKNILITFLSAKAVIDGQMTLGSMLAVQYIIGQLNSPIEQMIGFAQSLQNARISMDRLNEIHTLDDEEPVDRYYEQELPPSFTKQITGGKTDSFLDTAIETIEDNKHLEEDVINFENVSFSYPGAGSEPVLKDINLKIPRGKTTAIVGVSGSGKTTLLKLLLRFYEPQKGDIKLGRNSLSNISHKIWRANCGVVMQESFIFSDTIAKNIAVGAEKADMEKLRGASDVANVKEYIENLPLGYNTKIGAEGAGVSMGQKQRILIARAVYRNPTFIFFDEATNSLDANNESVILQNLDTFFRGRTVVVVAHRLSTVKNADQIVLLNKGVITERGTHKELVALKGEYYTLVKNQLELGN